MDVTRSTLSQRIQKAIPAFVSLFTSWVLLLLLMRIAEWFLNGFTHEFPASPARFLGWTLLSDLLFVCRIGLVLFGVFVLISTVSVRLARIVFIIITLLLTFIYFALLQYFNSTTVLLGADLYSYTWEDIKLTIGASGGLNWRTITLILLLIAAVVMSFYFLGRKIRPGFKKAGIIITVIILAGILTFAVEPGKPSFGKEFDNNLAENKIDFFLNSSYRHFFPVPHEVDIYSDAYIGDYGDTGGGGTVSFNYLDESNFPFLHADSTQDVLSPFFNTSSERPNIVIIAIEGMGRSFSNEGAYLGSFTPFLDSLSQHSLYWDNFLSGGGRTFAVLPTILGSLPFEKNGFNENKDKMPPHLSLAGILKKSGYHTSFYYAGDASFDNMDLFMQRQSVDQLRDRKTFPARYSQMPANNGFSWGFGDKELYDFCLQDQATDGKPSLSMILTVATHSPFLINNQSYYEQLVRQRMTSLKLNEDQQQEHLKYLPQYSTIMYADDALRGFISQYSKRADYHNTIFIITGDHRMPEIPMASKIDRYHVPLIIYSPLLNRSARFSSLSSHFDITPSLLAYLDKTYALPVPAVSAWIGSGLDTARSFRNVHATPLMQTKTDLVDFIMGNYHLNGNDLFRLGPALTEEKIDDAAMRDNLQAAFNRFKQKNDQLQQSGKLVPDSLMKKYFP